jgi:bacterioferritin-associated ferredoxin
MCVCLCNNYRDSDLREMARQGHRTAFDAFNALGRGPSCGHCLVYAQRIIDRVHSTSSSEATEATVNCD